MMQQTRRIYMLKTLLAEFPSYAQIEIPIEEDKQKNLLRALMNIRPPKPISDKFLKVQDAYLQAEIKMKGITKDSDLKPIQKGIYLWKGDMTTLECDAIVNAANNQMLGCFYPNHGCIDNAIHTYAGIELRLACAKLMAQQDSYEKTGQAKITLAYNLPCKYVIHTVGPIVQTQVTSNDCEQLANCYRACLDLASQYHLQSIAFCCISTGEFAFPNEKAAKIAIETVKDYLRQTNSEMKVIFNVFKERDEDIYRSLLQRDC